MEANQTELEGFIASPDKTRWIKQGPLTAYLRKSQRLFSDREGLQPCLDIANVQVDADYHNQGFFTRFVEEVLATQPARVYVESVLNPAVLHVALKLGFTRKEYTEELDVNLYRDSYEVDPKK